MWTRVIAASTWATTNPRRFALALISSLRAIVSSCSLPIGTANLIDEPPSWMKLPRYSDSSRPSHSEDGIAKFIGASRTEVRST